jgi:hypothetical protein
MFALVAPPDLFREERANDRFSIVCALIADDQQLEIVK